MWLAAKHSHHCDLCHAFPTMIDSTVSQNRPPLPAVASDQHHATAMRIGSIWACCEKHLHNSQERILSSHCLDAPSLPDLHCFEKLKVVIVIYIRMYNIHIDSEDHLLSSSKLLPC